MLSVVIPVYNEEKNRINFIDFGLMRTKNDIIKSSENNNKAEFSSIPSNEVASIPDFCQRSSLTLNDRLFFLGFWAILYLPFSFLSLSLFV